MNTPVPGLAVIREDGPRESYRVVHSASAIYLVRDLPGPGSAEDAALDLAPIADWTMTLPRILTVLEAFPELDEEMERIARKWGGTSMSCLPADESPFQVSA